MFFDDLLYHGFILPYLAIEETVLQPNAGPQAPPMAGARDERRLLAVACRPWFGGGHGEPSRSKARKPACWKCSSVVRASVRLRSCMTRKDTQSVSPHSLSGRVR